MKRASLFAVLSVTLASAALFASDEGSVKGVVKYEGEPPALKPKEVPAGQQKDCACAQVDNEELVVDKATKGIKWAIVRIDGVKAAEPKEPFKAPDVDQKGCHFSPHVVVVAPGTQLSVLNPDKIAHNVHTTPLDGTNTPINRMMVGEMPAMVVKGKACAEPELIQLECNIHGWMKGYIVVHDPRFCFVTGTDGTFEIKDVPAGKYKAHVFQEACGEKDLDIEVKAGQATDLGEVKFTKK